MKQENKNLYEGMYILSAQVTEDMRNKTLEKIEDGIKNRGGEIRKVHAQGKRRMAYAIGSHKEGYYYVLYFSLAPSLVKELWREYRLNEDLIRFLTLTAEEVKEELVYQKLPEN